MAYVPTLKKKYQEEIIPALKKEFDYFEIRTNLPSSFNFLPTRVASPDLGSTNIRLEMCTGASLSIIPPCGAAALGLVCFFIMLTPSTIALSVLRITSSTRPFWPLLLPAITTTVSPKKKYQEEIIPALKKEYDYSSVMQVPKLEKIILNQGVGAAIADKKLIDVAQTEMTMIAGQKAVQTLSKKDISNFKLRKKMPIGVRVTLRRDQMYEFLDRLISVALPRIRDFQGIESKMDGRGNYTLGVPEQIIFPEIVLDKVSKINGMNITFVTSAQTDEEGFALLKELGLPFKNVKKN